MTNSVGTEVKINLDISRRQNDGMLRILVLKKLPISLHSNLIMNKF